MRTPIPNESMGTPRSGNSWPVQPYSVRVGCVGRDRGRHAPCHRLTAKGYGHRVQKLRRLGLSKFRTMTFAVEEDGLRV
jgi:hypothetical protein